MITVQRYAINLTRLAVAALLAGAVTGVSPAQVVAPAEIKDPRLRALQSKHLAGLTAAAAEIASHNYPARFYLTRALDLRRNALSSADRRSVDFSMSGNQTVLLVRANYAAIYPAEMPPKDRVSRTYLDAAVPILTAAMQRVKDETEMDAVVIELSHHVRKGAVMTIDRYENYDITGQQLINAGFVLINGERAGLDLQSAETVKP
jgi:hypothetical protein